MKQSRELTEKPERPKSTLAAPVPYYPGLNAECGGVTAAILFTYLETHYPAPQDTSHQRLQRVTSLPVTLDSERVIADLQISRRTLVINLSRLSVWYPSEARRARAHGASREFIQPLHSRFGKIKPYSAVGPKNNHRPFVAVLRRNTPKISVMLGSSIPVDSKTSAGQDDIVVAVKAKSRPTSFAPSMQLESSRIVELLERASVLGGDRRNVRYTRLKRGIEGGIVSSEVIKRISRKSARSQDEDAR